MACKWGFPTARLWFNTQCKNGSISPFNLQLSFSETAHVTGEIVWFVGLALFVDYIKLYSYILYIYILLGRPGGYIGMDHHFSEPRLVRNIQGETTWICLKCHPKTTANSTWWVYQSSQWYWFQNTIRNGDDWIPKIQKVSCGFWKLVAPWFPIEGISSPAHSSPPDS